MHVRTIQYTNPSQAWDTSIRDPRYPTCDQDEGKKYCMCYLIHVRDRELRE